MKFMLMMHAPRGAGDYAIMSWSKPDITAHMEHMFALNRELSANGELVDAQGLDAPAGARIVRVAANGSPIVTDGPFVESKEFLAGYWIVEVESADRAYEIAARASAAPGPGGSPLGIPIEVRQVMELPRGDAAEDRAEAAAGV
jgi:hypothetical protein